MTLYVTRLRLPPEGSGRWEQAPDTPRVPDLLILGQLLGEFHRAARGGVYAIAFPYWEDPTATAPGTFGRLCDLLCTDRAVMESMLDCPKVRRLMRDHCTVLPLRSVPSAQVTGYARFRRLRRHDRVGPAAIRRILSPTRADAPNNALTTRVRALAAQGLEITAIASTLDRAPSAPHFHYRTTHTAQKVQLAIARDAAAEPGAFAFTSFGLARPGSAAPIINPNWI